MRLVVIIDVDPDVLMDLHPESSIKGAVEAELSWVEESSIGVVAVLEPEEFTVDTLLKHLKE